MGLSAFISFISTPDFQKSVFLVTVHNPIESEDGDIAAALSGSFLPIPSNDLFQVQDPLLYSRENLPGAFIARKENIVINNGRERVRLRVTNTGDRPVQVGVSMRDEGIVLNKHRLAHTTTSSRRTMPCLSIAAARMENVLTF